MNITSISSTIGSSVSIWIASTLAVTLGFWTCFGACVDPSPAAAPPESHIVAVWDPLGCGDPHRVVVELEDDAGVPLSVSAPCTIGGLTIEAPHYGIYRGQLLAWTLGQPERSVAEVELVVDKPVVRWDLQTP